MAMNTPITMMAPSWLRYSAGPAGAGPVVAGPAGAGPVTTRPARTGQRSWGRAGLMVVFRRSLLGSDLGTGRWGAHRSRSVGSTGLLGSAALLPRSPI